MKRSKHQKTARPSSSQHSDGSSIIPGLPNEVALCILARLPRALQVRHRLLCHSWKDAMEPARMTSLRKTLNISEPSQHFPSTPISLSFASWSQSLIHIEFHSDWCCGHRGFDCSNGLPHVLIRRRMAAAPSALDKDGGYLYVEGLQGVARLDIKTRMWEVLPDPHVNRVLAAGVVLQGLFYLIGGVYVYSPDDDSMSAGHKSGEIWDPKSKKWTLLPELWPLQVFGKVFDGLRVVVLMDRLYALRRAALVEELMYYEVASMLWLSMGHVPLDLASSNDNKYELSSVCLLAMDQELWVVNRNNKACIGTKPAFPQPPSWRVLPPTTERCLPIHWCKMVGVLQV